MSATPSFPPEHNYGPIPNYMVWAILITIASLCLCCVIGTIPGIVAIVFASQVNSKLSAGDRAGAERSSKNAKLWCWITTGLCILGLLVNIVFYATGGQEKYMEFLQQVEQQSQSNAAPSNEADEALEAEAFSVDATALHAAYSANEVAADQQFKGKLLHVTGTIEAIDSGLADEPVVRLSAGDFDSVHVKGLSANAAAALSKGQQISVACTGAGEVVGSPMLDDCSVL